MKTTAEKTVGEIVADDYRAARVFEGHGIDFCCGGKVPLAVACRDRGLEPAALEEELAAVRNTPAERGRNYGSWELPFLADYIVATHHAYLNDSTGRIAASARKIAGVHGARHPELVEIAALFDRIAADMTSHLREEEEVLFPAVKRLATAAKGGTAPEDRDRETVRASLATLDREHQAIGDAVHEIRRLAGGYALPAEACNTYRVTFELLREFEEDLHTHVHLENNILFPKAGTL